MSRLSYSEFKFSSAHFYAQEAWPKEKNESEFGKCFYPHGHGHDYKVEVFFEGEIAIFEKAKSEILELLDHHHLNFRIKKFQSQAKGGDGLVPTTENLSHFIWEEFFLRAPEVTIKRLRLFENADIWVELQASKYLVAK
jgi:6-pyruvoyltetrahydropterin/6-carboxytetrahydropterin synthase